MRGAERVVDVHVLSCDQPLDELRVARLLAGIEAQVLEQLDVGRELCEPRADRSHRVPLVGFALRTTEVAARRDVRAVLGEPLDRRERGSDAQVVDDLAVLEGHVEVRAEQDPLAAQVRKVFEERELHRVARRLRCSPRRR